ncbi:MAG: hypothetical protein U1F16_04350 [Turneriella sp.]
MLFSLLLLLALPSSAEAPQPLALTEVLQNLEKTFPVILLATREIRKAEFDILSAQGAFDLALKGSATNQSGYYDSNRFETNLEKPTSIWGTSFFAGYRFSQGSFLIITASVARILRVKYALVAEFRYGATDRSIRDALS